MRSTKQIGKCDTQLDALNPKRWTLALESDRSYMHEERREIPVYAFLGFLADLSAGALVHMMRCLTSVF